MKTHYFKNAHGMHHKLVIQKDEYEEIIMGQYKGLESELEFMTEQEYDVKDPLDVMIMDESGFIHLATITSEDFMKENNLRVVR